MLLCNNSRGRCVRRSEHVHCMHDFVAFAWARFEHTATPCVNNACHDFSTCPCSVSHFSSQKVANSGLYDSVDCSCRSMPKQLVPAGWVERPCRFFCQDSTASSCGFCQGEFSLWNNRRHCHFCGHVFHRRRCTRRIPVDGLFFRRRICPNCDYYRNVAAERLKQGSFSFILSYKNFHNLCRSACLASMVFNR